jgi:hypothetical protein
MYSDNCLGRKLSMTHHYPNTELFIEDKEVKLLSTQAACHEGIKKERR